jgi:hypothetical protein
MSRARKQSEVAALLVARVKPPLSLVEANLRINELQDNGLTLFQITSAIRLLTPDPILGWRAADPDIH